MKASTVLSFLVFVGLFSHAVSTRPEPSNQKKREAVDIQHLVRRAVANHQARQFLTKDYTFQAHCTWSHYDQRTKPHPPSTADYEIVFVGSDQYMRETRRNGQPLSLEQEKHQIAMMEAFLKARREAASRPGRDELFYSRLQLPIAQLPDAFILQGKGKTILDDREVYVVQARPKDGTESADNDQQSARRFKMTLWIDAVEEQLVKVEGELLRDIVESEIPAISSLTDDDTMRVTKSSWSRLYKAGSIVSLEWTKVGPNVWLPKHIYSKAQERWWTNDATSAGIWRDERDWTYSNYKRFGVTTTIAP
jgi:hypothetical protein